MCNLKGKNITEGLRAFNEWRDDFLIELSTLLLLVGFVTGTVDVFTKGGISTNPLFNVAWAIVQALAIDGLFFAVWGKIARARWTRADLFKNGMLIVVGSLLALVATLVNGILSYQELLSIPDVQAAMDQLGVAQATFTYARSILVVIVSILVALFCRSHRSGDDQQAAAMRALPEQPIDPAAASVALSYHDLDMEVMTRSQQKRRPATRAMPRTTGSPQDGYVAIDDGATVAIANGYGQSMIATGSHRERIKQAMLLAMQQGREVTYQEIAQAARVGYSTVKKYAPVIRVELEQLDQAKSQ